MGWEQQQDNEAQAWDEAYHLSLDADKAYLAWLKLEDAKLRAAIGSTEEQ
jgi:hypothetical protein